MYSPFQKGQAYYLANPPAMSGVVVRVMPGVVGYFHVDYRGDEKIAQAEADKMNGGPLDPCVAEAALAGSMFGWEVPGANPDLYAENTLGQAVPKLKAAKKDKEV